MDLDPAVASLIKHEFAFHLQWPSLTQGVVLENTTTCVNEEWLSAIEAMPSRHVFHAHVEDVLERRAGLCVFLKFAQSAAGQHVSLHDLDYFLVRGDALEAVEKPPQLREMLLHTFHDFRPKSEQKIELIAFGAGVEVSDKLVDALAALLDTEAFRREHENVKVVHPGSSAGTRPTPRSRRAGGSRSSRPPTPGWTTAASCATSSPCSSARCSRTWPRTRSPWTCRRTRASRAPCTARPRACST